MKNQTFAAVSAAAVLGLTAIVPVPALAEDKSAATISVSEKEPVGRYLADSEGLSLYMLEADTQGVGGTEAVSTCSDKCTEEWPPLTTSGEPQAGEQLDASLLSSIEREDGSMQVTYNGWPLYHYHDDKESGDMSGQDVHDDWGGWYLVSPSGEKNEGKAD
ncbi:hypothetical protein [Roseovarius sp. M141]|uniref:COG4315 family predicted lipoprotein n=1 Tax=Roseovarius sp. M141 TaxID=2583806 RepID=UPI0020CD9059|nr:hypothetical protein [Roseovarius sp. M141]MCQ0090290.1 hypothetical protein [Roseovarius sp. M141]